jgi:DnaK suppressor protein
MSASRSGKAGKSVPKKVAEAEVKAEKKLNQKEVKRYRTEIMKLLKSAQAEFDGKIPEIGVVADPADQACCEAACHSDFRTRERAQKLVGKIMKVLQLMDNGEYGLCEECGEQIPRARLDSRPIATKCVDCKIEAEQRDKKLWGKGNDRQREI